MKRKRCIYITEELADRLAAAASQLGVTKSGLVAAALHRFLDEAETVDDNRLSIEGHLAGMNRQLERLGHDLRIVNETVAMHARYHLAVTPPLPQAAQRAACTIGSARFDEFAAQVGHRVQAGKPLMRETFERLGRSDSFTPAGPVPTDMQEPTERPAAAQEGGSHDGFREPTGYRPHSTVQRRQA